MDKAALIRTVIVAPLGCLSLMAADGPWTGPRGMAMGGTGIGTGGGWEQTATNPAQLGFFSSPAQQPTSEVETAPTGSATTPILEATSNTHESLNSVQLGFAGGLQTHIVGRVSGAIGGMGRGKSLVHARWGQWSLGFNVSAEIGLDYHHLDLGLFSGQLSLSRALSALRGNSVGNISPTPESVILSTVWPDLDIGQVFDREMALIRNAAIISEVPISYGTPLGDQWAIGGSVKLLYGRVYGARFLGWNDIEDTLSGRADSFILGASDVDYFHEVLGYYNDSVSLGVDLGASFRSTWFQADIVGKNLNKPKLEGYEDTGYRLWGNINRPDADRITDILYGSTPLNDLTQIQALGQSTFTIQGLTPVRWPGGPVVLDPQVTLSGAFTPWDWLSIEARGDLLATQTLYEGYDEQFIGIGAEILAFDIVAFRGGVQKNIAGNGGNPIYSLGLGLKTQHIQVDLAASVDPKRTVIEGYDIPLDMALSAGVGISW